MKVKRSEIFVTAHALERFRQRLKRTMTVPDIKNKVKTAFHYDSPAEQTRIKSALDCRRFGQRYMFMLEGTREFIVVTKWDDEQHVWVVITLLKPKAKRSQS